MSYFIITAAGIIAAIVSFRVGLKEGRIQGELVTKYKAVSELKLFIDKVLELVPPNRYDEYEIQVQYLYDRINEKND